ncbi:hypothetical protein M153_310005583 [Pseudoloma neurophilia]|uniref:Uncharacterized protein n=1 Tax=Pseudoloma neurophilia TaxID=146866 RepID=A0A0R0M0N4_9MICR|nr:hypothetical protein M153_310005583 [Pseudoloma neurophilia]
MKNYDIFKIMYFFDWIDSLKLNQIVFTKIDSIRLTHFIKT